MRDGYLLAPEGPGLGTRLHPKVFEGPDVRVTVSDERRRHYIGWQH